MSLLSISGLRVSYRSGAGRVTAVDGVDLSVRPGEIVAVVGESGSGKSTTAHAVLGLLPGSGRIEAGSVSFAGEELAGASDRRLRGVRGREIGLVPQDPTVSLNPVRRIGAQVAEVLRIHGLADRRRAWLDAVDLLGEVGLPEPQLRARQYPHELSGGMRQRVLIAIALAAKPKLLIADEPTSALDVTVQRQILDLLDGLVAERGTAVLLITHDLGVAADRAQRLVVMSRGRVAETGPTRAVLATPGHPYTRALLGSAPSLATGRPKLSTPDIKPLVGVTDLVKDYPLPRAAGGPRSVRAVAGVSFTVRRGETFALVGESGSGKSTTARLVLRLVEPTSGRISFDGTDITAARGAQLRAVRRRAQLVYQNPYASLDPRFEIAEIVGEPLRVFRVGDRAERARRVASLIERVALPSAVLGRKAAELSGGQRQRVAIARALALSPDLVVCDEPVSALDVSVQAQVLELLVALQAELGLSYLFISHDLAVVRQVAHRVGVLRGGVLVETADTESLFRRPAHEYTRELLAAIPGQSVEVR